MHVGLKNLVWGTLSYSRVVYPFTSSLPVSGSRDMEEERSMDFLNLRPEDTDILKTYLTPEQTQLLHQGSEVNLTFTAEWTIQLDVIVCQSRFYHCSVVFIQPSLLTELHSEQRDG